AEKLIWMQDLGDTDLYAHRQSPWPVRARLYHAALGQVLKLHTHGLEHAANLTFEKEFDGDLYRWEQNYFFENCAGRYFEADFWTWHPIFDSAPLKEIAEKLAALPRVLVHRDFQSQNIMIWDGDAYLIDFQGIRPGLAQY